MPDNYEMRSAIRNSWLDTNYWSDLGVNIRIVFLIGRDDRTQLNDEIEKYDDILQIDRGESLYLLSIKDIAAMDYAADSCPQEGLTWLAVYCTIVVV